MAKNFVFKSDEYKLSFRVNETELDLAKKAYLTHKCEPINDNVKMLSCKNCNQNLIRVIENQNVYCTFENKPHDENPVIINKLCLTTCDENIIKKLIE